MNLETEAKLKVASHEEVRQILQNQGGEFLSKVLETTRHYDYADHRLRRMDSVLRVRTNELESGKGGGSTVTYKGPRLPGRMKSREELETQVEDADRMEKILGAIGLHPLMTIEKRRESWTFGGCRVELDEIPYLGTYVEIEGPDEATILQVQGELGLGHLDHVVQGYISLLHAYVMENGLPMDHVGF